MNRPYEARDDQNFQDLTWILVGVALADRDRVPELKDIMTEHATEVMPHKQRRILAAIIEGNGERVWDSLKVLGAERSEDDPTERAIDSVMRQVRKRIFKHVMIVMQRKLSKKAMEEDVDSFTRMMQEMLAELPTEEAQAIA